MADPLSVTASIIAVAGLAKATAKGIDKIVSKRHAPSLLLQLANEVHLSFLHERSLSVASLVLSNIFVLSPSVTFVLLYV